MLHLLLTTLVPIILLIALGTFLRIRGFLGESFWPGAERLSYFVLLPSLFLHGLATANLDGVPVLGMVGVLMLSTLLGAALLVLYQGAVNHEGADFTSVFQGGVRFNNYIGATLAAGLYGSAGIALAAVANAAIVPLVNLLCVLVFARFSARHSSPATVLRAIFANPLIVGCAGGLLLRVTGLACRRAWNPPSRRWARPPCPGPAVRGGGVGWRRPRPTGAATAGSIGLQVPGHAADHLGPVPPAGAGWPGGGGGRAVPGLADSLVVVRYGAADGRQRTADGHHHRLADRAGCCDLALGAHAGAEVKPLG